MDLLPYELILVIISYLDVLDIFNLIKVSRKFLDIKYDKGFWKKRMKKDFPNVSKNYRRYTPKGDKYLKTPEKKIIYYDKEIELCIRLSYYKKNKLQEFVNIAKIPKDDDSCIDLININNLPIHYTVYWGGQVSIVSHCGIVQSGVYVVMDNGDVIKITSEDNLSDELINKYLDEYIDKGYIRIDPYIINRMSTEDMELLGILEYE